MCRWRGGCCLPVVVGLLAFQVGSRGHLGVVAVDGRVELGEVGVDEGVDVGPELGAGAVEGGVGRAVEGPAGGQGGTGRVGGGADGRDVRRREGLLVAVGALDGGPGGGEAEGREDRFDVEVRARRDEGGVCGAFRPGRVGAGLGEEARDGGVGVDADGRGDAEAWAGKG